MAKPGLVRVVEAFSVASKPSSRPDSTHPEDLSLPLTFFDLRWLRFSPSQSLFFYEMPSFDASHFFDSILPKLKTSLSATLQHFVPLAGNLTWPLDFPEPLLRYLKGNAIMLTIAESDADFHRLISSNNFDIEAKQYHPLVPQLAMSHEKAAVLALQITVFSNGGFSIGSAMHHAVFDGLSALLFFKFWGHLCKHGGGEGGGPPPLPSYDRKVIKDPAGLQEIYSNDWLRLGGPNNRSLLPLEVKRPGDSIRGTFEFTRAKIETLRRSVMRTMMTKNKEQADHSKLLHLSTFSLTCAYTWVCLVRAEETKTERVFFIIPVDCRSRLDPPLPPTYFGNCIAGHRAVAETNDLLGEDGMFVALKAISDVIKSFDKTLLEGAETWVSRMFNTLQPSAGRIIPAAGSPRFEFYDAADFGWGRPTKHEVVSIDRTGTISFQESKNGGGGVEVGLVLKKHYMEAFASLFAKDLEENLSRIQ
ncbi:malonyl-CoA:anthocyanidin 5-O-glucoside-6''-O-malonyltransferase-like [Malus sylvestris]|uniref:malonyl-CoA:anthocyanidin 5-O-glucoside-6''-O-malonyltransferase-like n=1 Tax=Malus sylvestris TaxID=3752 RepID=UPI0021ACEA6F|nr:malonyl-CoA:anthocyanidin 5-O-glucoside-6''-O-malonyltransferase-like [Malus sylvestris]